MEPEPGPEDPRDPVRRFARRFLTLWHEGSAGGDGGDLARDARLAEVAGWGAARLLAGEHPAASAIEAAGRRVGHAGASPFLVLVRVHRATEVSDPSVDDALRRQLGALPANLVFDRYGIGAVRAGDDWIFAVALASVELTLDPVPKRVRAGGVVHLGGRVAPRFRSVRVSIAGPSGEVRNLRFAGRAFAADIALAEPGMHRVELLGDGPSGPVVVANLPLYADVDEPEVLCPPLPASTTDVEDSERQMLALVNAARAETHDTRPLTADPALAAIARAHSADMAAAGFLGHVSPTSGGPAERVARAGLRPSRVGEDVARAASVQEAFASFLDSPAHRANVVDPAFTRIGVGIAPRPAPRAGTPPPPSGAVLYVTLIFARP